MPIINVQLLDGRTRVQKVALIKALGEVAVRELGVPDEAVRVILTEVAPEHWGVGSRAMVELRPGAKQSG